VPLYLHHSVVRDALAGRLDWWAIGELLAMHPQAAFEQYANLADGTTAPAAQRPALAVTCTAGLAALHDLEPWYGIDIDDLDSGHSLSADPTVARFRETAAMLGEDIWIAVKLPGEFEGDDDLDEGILIRRWTTVVLHPDELGWLREALALNAEGEDPDNDEDEDAGRARRHVRDSGPLSLPGHSFRAAGLVCGRTGLLAEHPTSGRDGRGSRRSAA
jgi:hypothetical protein